MLISHSDLMDSFGSKRDAQLGVSNKNLNTVFMVIHNIFNIIHYIALTTVPVSEAEIPPVVH